MVKSSLFLMMLILGSCASSYQYKPYNEHGFSCTEMGEPDNIKCIEVDGSFDGTDFHKEYDVDYESWKDLR